MGRLESLRTRTRALGVNSQWLGALIIVAGLVVLLALVIGQLLSFELLTVATRPLFDLLGQVIVVLIYLVVIPLAYIIQLLIYLILSLIKADPNRVPPQPYQPADMDNLLQRLLSEGVSPQLLAVLKAAGAALVLGVALLLIARAAARWRSSSADVDAVAEERDSVWAAGRFQRALIEWLRALFRRGSSIAVGQSNEAPTSARETASPAVASVRELYRELLGLGESAGARRRSITTPLEHLPSLQHSLEPAENIARLTAAYVEVRYAEHEASSAQAASLQDQLAQVHRRDAQG
jgi:hypothetical protein